MSLLEVQLANHDARIANVEREQEDTSKKLDALRSWIMTTLGGVTLALVGIIISLLKH